MSWLFRKKNSDFLYLIGILLACVLILWPFIKPGFIVTDDGDWMVIRLSAFFQSLREGQFPVRFLGRLNFSYGYPVANFLYPGFLYLGSLIHLLGISFPDTVKVIFLGSVVASAYAVFAWLRKHFSLLSSFIGTLSFIFAPYLLFDIYKRGSVGEVLALFPAALGFYSIDAKKSWLLPWAIGLLILSHNSLALMFGAVLAAYLLVRGDFRLLVPFGLGISLATFFWFPALWERKFVVFDQISISEPARYFIQKAEIFLLGLSGVAAAGLLLVVGNKLRRSQFLFFITVFVTSILLSTPVSSMIWQNALFAKLFQFPSRFLAIGLLAGAWLVSYIMESYAKKHGGKLLVLFSILWIGPLFSILTGVKTVERPSGFYTTNEATTTVRDEYLPLWVVAKPKTRANQQVVFYKGRGKISLKIFSTQHIEANLETEEDSLVQINTIFYPGWGAAVDGQPAIILYQNPQGVMRVPVAKGNHRLVAEFRETVPRFLADIVSLVGGGVAVLYLFLKTKANLGWRSKKTPVV